MKMTPSNGQHHHHHRHHHHHQKCLPKRIILVRHGECQAFKDEKSYYNIPNHKIQLTPEGVQQAMQAGTKLVQLLSTSSDDHSRNNWKVHFYVSPYERTRSTLREMGRALPRERLVGVREECRIREQDFGNFQVAQRMKTTKEERLRFGRFFYRCPDGESVADVFDRVSSFLESLWRDIDNNRLKNNPEDELNLIIISHGLTIRAFLMKWFKWTVQQFENLYNLENCEFRVMQLGSGGEYSLAVHHTEEEMRAWGLSPEMIADQKWRAQTIKGSWNEKRSWYLDVFFDKLADSDDNAKDDNESK